MPILPLSKNLKIHYLDPHPQGNPTVLLLHGLGANGSSWTLQSDPLASAGYRPIAPDARGFGLSSYPGGMPRIERMAEDMAALMSALEIDAAHIVGISLGGTLALSMALAFPEKVRKLVLVNTAAWLLPGDLSTWMYYAARLLAVYIVGIPRQAQIVSRRIFPRPAQADLRRMLEDQIQQADPRAYRGTMLALARFDARADLPSISAPTLVITGDQDTTIPPDRQHQLAAGIPAARYETIAGAGHAVTVEQPDRFNALLLDFLSP